MAFDQSHTVIVCTPHGTWGSCMYNECNGLIRHSTKCIISELIMNWNRQETIICDRREREV